MNTFSASPQDSVTYRGLTERLVVDQLISPAGASEIAEVAEAYRKP